MEQIKPEIKKEPYEKPILTIEGKLRDAAALIVTDVD